MCVFQTIFFQISWGEKEAIRFEMKRDWRLIWFIWCCVPFALSFSDNLVMPSIIQFLDRGEIMTVLAPLHPNISFPSVQWAGLGLWSFGNINGSMIYERNYCFWTKWLIICLVRFFLFVSIFKLCYSFLMVRIVAVTRMRSDHCVVVRRWQFSWLSL